VDALSAAPPETAAQAARPTNGALLMQAANTMPAAVAGVRHLGQGRSVRLIRPAIHGAASKSTSRASALVSVFESLLGLSLRFSKLRTSEAGAYAATTESSRGAGAAAIRAHRPHRADCSPPRP
jgi:hypothetical protein